MSDSTYKMLMDHLEATAQDLNDFENKNGEYEDWTEDDDHWLNLQLGFTATVPMDTPKKPEILTVQTAVGGPNIWVDFYSNWRYRIRGTWGGASAEIPGSREDTANMFERLKEFWLMNLEG